MLPLFPERNSFARARGDLKRMKAIILSAGQGKRLLPLTAERPKCAVAIHGQSMIEWQVDELLKCGVKDISVVLGYAADTVEALLEERYGRGVIRTLFNPFYAVADNLGSCWIARSEMTDDFILLNGDTMFRAAVLEKLLASAPRPITVTVDRKDTYDGDDMKVILDGERLVRIGKNLLVDQVDAESIGMLLFRGEGADLFRRTVEQLLRDQVSLKRWYLSVIDELAQQTPVWTCCIEGLAWGEVDCPEDLKRAEEVVRGIAG
ncbi:Nucleotidyl transferase [Pelobacter propionicus DSM 2379]|uniref:Nucleotidyl transferase n=2 Tax=Pelobacter propionicus TaxID=29543 RepID=A1ASQ3_PELPD|nr:Nucleotidyl transferase [Pelobacter propionicus DSM 2379]